MASLSSSATVVLLLLFLHITLSLSSSSPYSSTVSKSSKSSRSLSDAEEEEDQPAQRPPPLRKKPILVAKNLTKLLKPKKTNSTATAKSTAASLGKTAASFGKATNSTKIKFNKTLTATPKLSIGKVANATKVKLNKTLTATPKQPNSSKLIKPLKSTKSNSTNASKVEIKLAGHVANSTKSSKKTNVDLPTAKSKTGTTTASTKSQKQQQTQPPAPKKPSKASKPNRSTSWMVEEAEDDAGVDLISDFRDLPSRLLPDLDRISTTSKAYISAANRGIADSVRPYVGKSFAPKVAPFLSSLFLALPLLLLALVFRRLRAYLSLHRLLVFIQAYLAIYFATLAVTSLVTGLEPLRFFYATSPGSYAWTQAAQTMGYVVYLVVQLIDLVTVFSPNSAEDSAGGGKGVLATARALGLAQMVIGLGVGAHYYIAVFHRAVAGEPPRANWRVHAVYAACFVVICACARAERRKKVYEDGEDGKKN